MKISAQVGSEFEAGELPIAARVGVIFYPAKHWVGSDRLGPLPAKEVP
jgi:hypothetical protein